MTNVDWLLFKYRNFYDVPRAIVVEFLDILYLLDCPFDEHRDEYPHEYAVYRLPRGLDDKLDTADWSDLAQEGERVGRILVKDVEFDPSLRKAIHAPTFQHLVD